jgi:hypothetical protein
MIPVIRFSNPSSDVNVPLFSTGIPRKTPPRVRKCDVYDANLYNQDLSRKKRVDEINETDNNDGNISTKLDENVPNISSQLPNQASTVSIPSSPVQLVDFYQNVLPVLIDIPL